MPPKSAAATEWQQKRAERMKANKAFLSGAEAAAAPILAAQAKIRADKEAKEAAEASARKRVRKAPARRAPAAPLQHISTRRSARVAEAADPDARKRKREDGDDTLVSLYEPPRKDPDRKIRVSGDLDFKDITLSGGKFGEWTKLPFAGAEPGVRTFDDDVPESTDEGVKELRGRMNKLVLYEKYDVKSLKITPQRCYALGFHPSEEKIMIFAGDKEGHLGMFDATANSASDSDKPALNCFKVHARTITSILFSSHEPSSVYTSSYDSSIRKMDLNKGKALELWAPTDPEDDEHAVSCMEIPTQDPNLAYFTTLHGALWKYDTRTPKSDAEMFSIHDQKIGGFALDPSNPHLVATTSLDRTLKIWDLRKIKGTGSHRRPALLGEHESRLSVSHASWSRSGKVATTSYDNTVKIYDFSTARDWTPGHDISEKAMKPTLVLPHNNQTGRWVTILKPQWQRNTREGPQKFAIGNMNRFVDVYAENGEQVTQLEGDGITAVPAVAHLHPTLDIVAGGNASGKLCLWMEGEDDDEDGNEENGVKEEDED